MSHLHERNITITDGPSRSRDTSENPFEKEGLSEDAIFAIAYSYGIDKGNPIDTLHAIEKTTPTDHARELGLVLDIARVYSDALDRASLEELAETIRHSAFNLIASKLSQAEVITLQLGNRYVDDADTSEVIDFSELLKIAQSWDYLDQDPRILQAIEMLTPRFDSKTTEHITAAFARAIDKDIPFAQADLDIQARYNEIPVKVAARLVGEAALDVCQKTPLEGYDWLFSKDSTRKSRTNEAV